MISIVQPIEAVIFVGMQASGKTSFYPQRSFEIHLRISLDMLTEAGPAETNFSIIGFLHTLLFPTRGGALCQALSIHRHAAGPHVGDLQVFVQ